MERKVDVYEFKEELWDTVVEFEEPILMETGLDKEAREEFLSKIVQLRETWLNTEPKSCKNSSNLKNKKELGQKVRIKIYLSL